MFSILKNVNCIKIQILALDKLENLFYLENIKNIKNEDYFFIGNRGSFDGKENYTIKITLFYFNYNFEFYLSYDQLEYYITKDGKKLKECNLEDFWEEDIHIEKFINYLKKDLKSLDIPAFQSIQYF
jgi:hypothetical protein